MKMVLFEKLKSDSNQTWLKYGQIWGPSYVHAVKGHTKVKGHLRSGCKIS